MTKTLSPPRPRPAASEDEALAFAHAYYRWLRLSQEPQAWTEPDRQRTLAAAFLRFHAAKLALSEAADAQKRRGDGASESGPAVHAARRAEA